MNTLKVESRFVVKVVQMKDREETRVGTCVFQHGPRFERFESIGHVTCGEAASPLVEVAEDDAGGGPGLFFEYVEEVSDLVAALDETGAEVQIKGVDGSSGVESEVGAEASAGLAAEMGEVVVVGRLDRKAAECHVARKRRRVGDGFLQRTRSSPGANRRGAGPDRVQQGRCGRRGSLARR